MKLENQVTSLETSKKLKALGVEQESYFMWTWEKEHYCNEVFQKEHLEGAFLDQKSDDLAFPWISVSAFTASELLEMLPWAISATPPDMVHPRSFFLEVEKVNDQYMVGYRNTEDGGIHQGLNNSLSEAAGICVEALKQNKLI